MFANKHYAALIVPRFRLQAALLEAPAEKSQFVAVVEGGSTRGVLLEVSAGAEAQGVSAGMVATQAMARCAQLVLLLASEMAEARLGRRLLRFVETLSPRVEKQANDLWMIDLRGVIADMGVRVGVEYWTEWGEETLRRLRVNEGIEAKLGVALRPGLALCAARRAQPVRVVEAAEAFVEELRFEELGVSGLLCRQLHDWGLSTLGDLLRLPRQAALERLGPEAGVLWEIARDSRESVLRLETFSEPLELAVDFEHPVETVAPILFTLNRMLEQLCSRMRLLHRVAAGLLLRFTLDNGGAYERRFTVPAPSREEAVLLRILETHLETLQFEASLTGAILKIEATTPSSQQLALFENPLRDPNRFGETLARLRALVGEDRVGVPVASNTYRSDVFVLADPTSEFVARETSLVEEPSGAVSSLNGVLLGLPLRRFRPALAAQVQLQAHQPAYVASSVVSGPVVESRGPFRLSGDWWDSHPWHSEQWDVLLGGSARGLYRLCLNVTGVAPAGAWLVEGCYDAAVWPSKRLRR